MSAAIIEMGQLRMVDRGIAYVDDVILITGPRSTIVVVPGNGLEQITVMGRACVGRTEAGAMDMVVRLYRKGCLTIKEGSRRQEALTIRHGRRG